MLTYAQLAVHAARNRPMKPRPPSPLPQARQRQPRTHMSREQVRQIEQDALRKLRGKMRRANLTMKDFVL